MRAQGQAQGDVILDNLLLQGHLRQAGRRLGPALAVTAEQRHRFLARKDISTGINLLGSIGRLAPRDDPDPAIGERKEAHPRRILGPNGIFAPATAPEQEQVSRTLR